MREITTQETGYVSGGCFVCDINLAGISFAAGLFTAGFIILGGIVLLNGNCKGNTLPTPTEPPQVTATPSDNADFGI